MSKHPDSQWIEAKQRCRLNQEDIRMAKMLGLNPRKLIKNIPSKNELWKLSVKDWIRELYFKKINPKVLMQKPEKEA